MKYFFLKNNNYFNPVVNKYELTCFDIEVVNILQYSIFPFGNSKWKCNNKDKSYFIDLENSFVQYYKIIFLIILRSECGLYLNYKYELTTIPTIWNYYININNNISILYLPNCYSGNYFSLTFTNYPLSLYDFFSIYKYCIFYEYNKKLQIKYFNMTFTKIDDLIQYLKVNIDLLLYKSKKNSNESSNIIYDESSSLFNSDYNYKLEILDETDNLLINSNYNPKTDNIVFNYISKNEYLLTTIKTIKLENEWRKIIINSKDKIQILNTYLIKHKNKK